MDKHQARLREALAGPPTEKSKGPPVADGSLTATPDAPETSEWRNRPSVIDGPSTSSYLEDNSGPQPYQLYGKFTWKIENFKDVQKRELRSSVFTVGDFKWYVLVYPQGCDVCNHLSLFLCVADYDKLLPGWAHFAQFTISVVNKDPKKSKFSDTLHRFCKKEHDWGWKKFMEINKVFEGFASNDTLTIKAQVQVIRDRPSAPFRCLDPQYRRELVRVYLSNVETICRKFVDEKIGWLKELNGNRGFCDYWNGLSLEKREDLQKDRGQDVLKGLVKRFFNEKEVTSTLVMDALFCGCKLVEEESRKVLQARKMGDVSSSGILVNVEKNTFGIIGNALHVLQRTAQYAIPGPDKGTDTLNVRSGQDGDDYGRDSVERDECRLADFGRLTVEVFIVSVIFAELEKSHHEAVSLMLGNELIKEVENSKMQEGEKADKNREKRAQKKERRRQKKEAEEKEREAREAARRAQEALEKEELAKKEREAAELRRREEDAREKEREAALQEAAASARARRAPQSSSFLESRGDAKPLLSDTIQAPPASDDDSDSPGRGGEPDVTERQGQPGEDSKAGTSARGECTVSASVVDSEDAYSEASHSSSSVPSDEVEAVQQDLTPPGRTADVFKLQSTVAQLGQRVETLEHELQTHREALHHAEAALAETRGLLAEREAEISLLKSQAVAVLGGRVTPTLPLISSTSFAGSASTTTVGDLASTMSDASVDSRLSSPPQSPGALHGRPNGLAVSDEGDTVLSRQAAGVGPAADSMQGLENGMSQTAGQLAGIRMGRPPWNGGLGMPNGPGVPPHAGSSTARVRHAKSGSSVHPPGLSNGAVARPSQMPDTSAAALKEATAAVERALRPVRTVSVPEPLAQAVSQLQKQPVGAAVSKPYGAVAQRSGKTASAPTITKTLNGAAVPFVPAGISSAMSAPPHPAAPSANGIASAGLVHSGPPLAPSYRNAAAGTHRLPSGSLPNLAPRPGAASNAPLPPGPVRAAAVAPSESHQGHRPNGDSSVDGGPSLPPGSTALPAMQVMNTGQENGFRAAMYRCPPPGTAPFLTPPIQSKRAGETVSPAQDTPGGGMDDFAHMGLITDLLD